MRRSQSHASHGFPASGERGHNLCIEAAVLFRDRAVNRPLGQKRECPPASINVTDCAPPGAKAKFLAQRAVSPGGNLVVSSRRLPNTVNVRAETVNDHHTNHSQNHTAFLARQIRKDKGGSPLPLCPSHFYPGRFRQFNSYGRR
jgi:hypothetical protein